MINRARRIVLTGGGSGGHVYPLLAVTEQLERIAIAERLNLEIFYLGPDDPYVEIMRKAGVKIKMIHAGKLRRYLSASNIIDIPKFFFGIIESLWILYVLMPDVIFSKGGTGALPVIFAGWFYQIKIMIHESDAVPGLTNAISSRFASRIAVSFEAALKYFNPAKTAWVGSPMRRDLAEGQIDKHLAKQELGMSEAEPFLLVLGGSQGSRRINEFIVSILPDILKEVQVFHQTGMDNVADVEKLSRIALAPLGENAKQRYKAVPYIDKDMPTVLSAADLAVARSGSGTMFELAAFGVPAILIPLAESAQNHQRLNAHEFARAGGGIVIEESNLTPGIFLSQFRSIMKNQGVLATMSAAAKKFFKPDAAETIARELINIS